MKKQVTILLVTLMVLGAASAVRADYFDDFESRSLGSLNAQAPEWTSLAGRQDFDVATVDAFSGTQSIQNMGSGAGTFGRAFMFPTPVTGNDVVISFMMKRNPEYDWTELNRVRMDVYASNGSRVAVSYKIHRIYDENTSWNMIDNVPINAWYKLEVALLWNGTDYGDDAVIVSLFDDTNHVLPNGIQTFTTGGGVMNDVSYLNLSMNNGSGSGVPEIWIDDFSIVGGTIAIPEPSMVLLGLGSLLMFLRRKR